VVVWPRTGAPPAITTSASPAAAPPAIEQDIEPATATQAAPRITLAVAKADEGRLPRLKTALPDLPSLDGTVPLSAAPTARALALYQRSDEAGHGPVLVLGDDRRLRELDGVELATVTDPHGNEQIPLDETALSPDGRLAAFPQRDEVVVVDLTAATSRRWPVPGFNEIVSWHPDGVTLVVEQEDTTYLVDSRTGHTARQPYPGFGTVAGGRPGTDLFRLRTPDSGKPELTRWDTAGRLLGRATVELGVGTGEWWGTGWLRDGRIARDVFGAGGPRPYADVVEAEAIVTLDAATGEQTAALVLTGMDRWKGCCQVLGWYDADTVLFASRGGPPRLLAWRVSSGELLRVADLPEHATLALGELNR
jgi:hypothetical protein